MNEKSTRDLYFMFLSLLSLLPPDFEQSDRFSFVNTIQAVIMAALCVRALDRLFTQVCTLFVNEKLERSAEACTVQHIGKSNTGFNFPSAKTHIGSNRPSI